MSNSSQRFAGQAMLRTEFDDVAMGQSSFTNVNLAGSKIKDCNLAQVAIIDSNTTGMTIEGIPVQEALAAWRAVNQPGNLQDRH